MREFINMEVLFGFVWHEENFLHNLNIQQVFDRVNKNKMSKIYRKEIICVIKEYALIYTKRKFLSGFVVERAVKELSLKSKVP